MRWPSTGIRTLNSSYFVCCRWHGVWHLVRHSTAHSATARRSGNKITLNLILARTSDCENYYRNWIYRRFVIVSATLHHCHEAGRRRNCLRWIMSVAALPYISLVATIHQHFPPVRLTQINFKCARNHFALSVHKRGTHYTHTHTLGLKLPCLSTKSVWIFIGVVVVAHNLLYSEGTTSTQRRERERGGRGSGGRERETGREKTRKIAFNLHQIYFPFSFLFIIGTRTKTKVIVKKKHKLTHHKDLFDWSGARKTPSHSPMSSSAHCVRVVLWAMASIRRIVIVCVYEFSILLCASLWLSQNSCDDETIDIVSSHRSENATTEHDRGKTAVGEKERPNKERQIFEIKISKWKQKSQQH